VQPRYSDNRSAASRPKAASARDRPLLNQRASVGAVGFLFWGDDYGGGYAVAGFEVQQAHALGVAAGFADGF